ncbi:MAG: glycosyltransferase family 4 protein [Planctomycetes bacterium]|nr:glycosyltransferase family 4 protein [Planctomycetota bacterium]
MIKTAIIIERVDVSLGGAERSVSELSAQLSADGIDVTILAAKGSGDSDNIKVLCENYPGKRTPLKVFGEALKKHLCENDYDIIHSTLPFDFADIYQPRGGSYLEAMIRNADTYSNPFVRNFKKATHFTNFKRYAMVRAEKHLCSAKNNTIIAALSQYVADQFKRHYDIAGERIKVIANAVNTEIISNPIESDKLRNNWLNDLNAANPSKAVIFLFGANNFRLKGLPSLLKAVRILKSGGIGHNVFVVVAGNGKIARYKTLAESDGISKNVLFAGAVSNMPQALAASDVVVLPSFYDPCSRFILEGLIAGKPAITTRFNGACEAYENNRHGKIIADGSDAESLAEAMKYFAIKENIQAASTAIEDDNLQGSISIKRHSREMIELYKEIITRRDK